jgi:hypothetical protein
MMIGLKISQLAQEIILFSIIAGVSAASINRKAGVKPAFLNPYMLNLIQRRQLQHPEPDDQPVLQ